MLELILKVRDSGIPVILISHNMPHVFEVADRIHIHRLGQRIAVVTPKTPHHERGRGDHDRRHRARRGRLRPGRQGRRAQGPRARRRGTARPSPTNDPRSRSPAIRRRRPTWPSECRRLSRSRERQAVDGSNSLIFPRRAARRSPRRLARDWMRRAARRPACRRYSRSLASYALLAAFSGFAVNLSAGDVRFDAEDPGRPRDVVEHGRGWEPTGRRDFDRFDPTGNSCAPVRKLSASAAATPRIRGDTEPHEDQERTPRPPLLDERSSVRPSRRPAARC